MTDPPTSQEEPTLADDVGQLLTRVRSHSRRLSRVKNLLKKVSDRTPDAKDFETWLEVLHGLDGYEVGVDEVDELRDALVDRIAKSVERLRIKARMTFMTKLEMLSGDETPVQKISESPLVLYIEPLTFEVDFDEGGVTMLYGHEAIDELPINAATLIEARRDAVAEMNRQLVDSEEFFDQLFAAYEAVRAAHGVESEERVDLVDVLVPLSMLRADQKTLRKKGVDALKPFPRYLLARQLAGLRRDGLLERDGLRLDLGAATGGSTRDKDDVLYIPVGPKDGQYYGSIRFYRTSN